MRALLVFIFVTNVSLLRSQKSPVSLTTYKSWPKIEGRQISNDGNFILYSASSFDDPNKMVLLKSDTSWSFTLHPDNPSFAKFTKDSKLFVTIQRDTLKIIDLVTFEVRDISNVNSFKLCNTSSFSKIFYKDKNSNYLRMVDLKTHTQTTFTRVDEYFTFNNDQDVLMLSSFDSLKGVQTLSDYDIGADNLKEIAKESKIFSPVFNDSLTEIAYLCESPLRVLQIGYYSTGMDVDTILIKNNSSKIPSTLSLSSNTTFRFSQNGKMLFFSLVKPLTNTSDTLKSNSGNVQIWNYKNSWESPKQRSAYTKKTNYWAAFQLDSKKIYQLDSGNDIVLFNNAINNHFVLLFRPDNPTEENWLPSQISSLFLKSLTDSSTILIDRGPFRDDVSAQIDPNENFVIFYRSMEKKYFSYSIKKRSIIDFTRFVSRPLYDETNDNKRPPIPYGIAGWLRDTPQVLIYDRFDIWKLDMSGALPPVNITQHIGRKENVIFRIVSFKEEPETKIFNSLDTCYVSLLSETTKDNSIAKVFITGQKVPIRFPFRNVAIYFLPTSASNYVSLRTTLLKSANKTLFVIPIMSANQYPNLYLTSDFRDIRQITNIHPQTNYNWYTSELIHWKKYDGSMGTGILYKPEDFNPKEHYPTIFYFYERLSNSKNLFQFPFPSNAELNISYFVSNHFLVFVPDIYYRVGDVGGSLYNTLVSAFHELSKKPWFNISEVGILGHSFGGYQVNSILTKTNIFSAAVSCAGVSDLLDIYGQLDGFGNGFQYSVEVGQLRMGGLYWKNKIAYERNSPINYADKISTPLLMMHNQDDQQVPWEQSFQLFSCLRRLQKPSWLIQYTNEGHIINSPDNQLDFSNKLYDFFKTYLLRAPAPSWMNLATEANGR